MSTPEPPGIPSAEGSIAPQETAAEGSSSTALPEPNPQAFPTPQHPYYLVHHTEPAEGRLIAEKEASASPPPLVTDSPIPGIPREPWFKTACYYLHDYFLGEDPTFWVAMVPLLILSTILYTRHPATNFIFDEQEALLANPYVHGKNLRWLDAFHRDFWGLPPDRSVGSYRPIPNLIWRLVWHISQNPWLEHWFNVLLHAANGACLVVLVYLVTRRRGLAWLAGAIFTACAVLTEAVSGVVGIADVLGGFGALLGLLALWLPLWAMPLGVCAAVFFGLFSKESALVCVPLIPFAALVFAPISHNQRPWRAARALVALVASTFAFITYVEIRKRLFPSPTDPSLLTFPPPGASKLARTGHTFLLWFHQPTLPKDPLNNPLIKADIPYRIAGALRVYWRGLTQLVAPITLAGDYSFPQEPIPNKIWSPQSVLGGLALVLPPFVSLGLWARALLQERMARLSNRLPQATALLVIVGLMWIPISYFPHSNIPVLLPTVRAERFWYFPAIGSSLLLSVFFASFFERMKRLHKAPIAAGFVAFFFAFQCAKAYQHSTHYRDDLTFWAATRDAVPYNAKAHLNYSVMYGARSRLDIRLEANRRALELAPQWPMARVYLGDTLCRMHRSEEAWPHYKDGFAIAPNDPNLIALALQCLWDERIPMNPQQAGSPSAPSIPDSASMPIPPSDSDEEHVFDDSTPGPSNPNNASRAFYHYLPELLTMADAHSGSWLAYLVRDMASNAEKNNGVDPRYRPRGYNEGPKELP